VQPLLGEQESVVHGLLSLQVIELWWQVPPEQVSVVQAFESPQSLFELHSGQEPQSAGQLWQVSPLLQIPSPQYWQEPQSLGHDEQVSAPLQTPSPQYAPVTTSTVAENVSEAVPLAVGKK